MLGHLAPERRALLDELLREVVRPEDLDPEAVAAAARPGTDEQGLA